MCVCVLVICQALTPGINICLGWSKRTAETESVSHLAFLMFWMHDYFLSDFVKWPMKVPLAYTYLYIKYTSLYTVCHPVFLIMYYVGVCLLVCVKSFFWVISHVFSMRELSVYYWNRSGFRLKTHTDTHRRLKYVQYKTRNMLKPKLQCQQVCRERYVCGGAGLLFTQFVF